MRGVTRYCEPFVEYGEREHRPVSRESLRLYFVAPSAVGMVEHSVTRERSTTFARFFRQ